MHKIDISPRQMPVSHMHRHGTTSLQLLNLSYYREQAIHAEIPVLPEAVANTEGVQGVRGIPFTIQNVDFPA